MMNKNIHDESSISYHLKTAVIVIITLTMMTWLSTWEMPVDTEQLKLDSLKSESAKLQIY